MGRGGDERGHVGWRESRGAPFRDAVGLAPRAAYDVIYSLNDISSVNNPLLHTDVRPTAVTDGVGSAQVEEGAERAEGGVGIRERGAEVPGAEAAVERARETFALDPPQLLEAFEHG